MAPLLWRPWFVAGKALNLWLLTARGYETPLAPSRSIVHCLKEARGKWTGFRYYRCKSRKSSSHLSDPYDVKGSSVKVKGKTLSFLAISFTSTDVTIWSFLRDWKHLESLFQKFPYVWSWFGPWKVLEPFNMFCFFPYVWAHSCYRKQVQHLAATRKLCALWGPRHKVLCL